LIAQVGTATAEVAKLRRDVPNKTAAAYAKKLAADIDKEAALAEAALKDNDSVTDEDVNTAMIDWGIKPLMRQEEVEKAWEDAVGLLPVLKKVGETCPPLLAS